MNAYSNTPDYNEIQQALAYIPSDDRDVWLKICFAIKSVFPDESGFVLFNDWSSRAGNYDSNAVKSTWKNAKNLGKVHHSSIFYEAKRYGYVMSGGGRYTPTKLLSPEEQAQKAKEEQQRAEQEALSQEKNRAYAKQKAIGMWAGALTQGDSSYLKRKRVGAYGVKFLSNDCVLIPVINPEDGELCNLQRIYGVSPDGTGTNKLFLKGGLLKGCYHVIGDLLAFDIILIAEGYATGASLHEACGLPVVIAFNGNNLLSVALSIRSQHPQKQIFIAGDSDTKGRKNTGLEKAKEAGKAISGGWFIPSNLAEGESDFNDIAVRCGLEEVKRQVMNYLSGGNLDEPEPSLIQETTKDKKAVKKSKGEPSGIEIQEQSSNNRFILENDAVYYCGVDSKGNVLTPAYVCSYLVVKGRTHNKDGLGWGYLLEFYNHDKQLVKYVMQSEYLYTDGAKLAGLLAEMGLDIDVKTSTRQRLKEYINLQAKGVNERVTVTDTIGWYGNAFVLPTETIGGAGKTIIYNPSLSIANNFTECGTVEDWQNNVAKYCVNNSRLAFAVSCAFAGILLKLSHMESGGFNLLGASSTGKSTALDVACSVFGGADFKKQWRATDNALEATASIHSDTLLVLDEMKQLDSKVAGACAYMLANGQSKGRLNKHGDGARPLLTWRLLFLSSGELSLSDLMSESGQKTYAGQQVRLPDVMADAGAGMGLFEDLHGIPTPREFADFLKANTRKTYGAVGKAFIQALIGELEGMEDTLKQSMNILLKTWLCNGVSGQVERVASRFALVAVAGEMATMWGLTGWEKGEAANAVYLCFKSWLDNRGGLGDLEEMAVIQQVRQFISEHGDSRFQWVHRADDTHAPRVINRAGYKLWVADDGTRIRSKTEYITEYGQEGRPHPTEKTSAEYLVLADVFKNELCKGFDYKMAQRVLFEKGYLRGATEGDKVRYTRKERIPAVGSVRAYCILPTILEVEED